MKRLTLCGSLLAIVGSTISFTIPATAIEAIFRTTTQYLNLPFNNDEQLIIHRVTVPAGSKVITYSVSVTNYYVGEFVRCGLRANGSFVEQHTAVVGGGQSATNAATISGVTYRTSTVPYTLDLVCSHDGGGTSIPTIDAYAELAVF
ncbi:MAG: hypothetical protein V7K50_05160 [Nostoc sp.]|uniref:hypothetical protein n=1 Tax=Nostoc sp. TaxID=1180 RepID=UPI002FF53AA9